VTSTGTDERVIAAPAGRGTASQVLRVVLLGCTVAAVFGSAPLLGWTEALPDNGLTAALHDAATRWNDAMASIGATAPRDRLRAGLRAVEAKHFTQ
jgi:hypothetical protein